MSCLGSPTHPEYISISNKFHTMEHGQYQRSFHYSMQYDQTITIKLPMRQPNFYCICTFLKLTNIKHIYFYPFVSIYKSAYLKCPKSPIMAPNVKCIHSNNHHKNRDNFTIGHCAKNDITLLVMSFIFAVVKTLVVLFLKSSINQACLIFGIVSPNHESHNVILYTQCYAVYSYVCKLYAGKTCHF